MAGVGRVRVVVHRAVIAEITAGPVLRHIRAIGRSTRDNAVMFAPKRTGRLASAIEVSPGSAHGTDASIRVSINTRKAPYARFVINNTGPSIRAKNSTYLVLRSPGWPFKPYPGKVIGRADSVRGYPANHFMERALRVAMDEHRL